MVTACSTGAHAIGDAARLIALDDADVMVCGGAEAAICRPSVSPGYCGGARPFPPTTTTIRCGASRPWDQGRDGFVMGEARRASSCSKSWSTPGRAARRIYAEVIGYGMSGDAYHLTALAEDGNGAFRVDAQCAEECAG